MTDSWDLDKGNGVNLIRWLRRRDGWTTSKPTQENISKQMKQNKKRYIIFGKLYWLILQKLIQSYIFKQYAFLQIFIVKKVPIILFSYNWCFAMKVLIWGLHWSHKIAREIFLLLWRVSCNMSIIYFLFIQMLEWVTIKPFGPGVCFVGKYPLRFISEIIVCLLFVLISIYLMILVICVNHSQFFYNFSVFFSVSWKMNFFHHRVSFLSIFSILFWPYLSISLKKVSFKCFFFSHFWQMFNDRWHYASW